MDKILFVCRANVGRSQAAMELYRRKGGQADSAGTLVDAPGASLVERPTAQTIVDIMRNDYAIDMIKNTRTQLTEEVAEGYDKLIVMAQRETVPEWLWKDPRMEYWEVTDTLNQDAPTTRAIVRHIESNIDTMIRNDSDAQ